MNPDKYDWKQISRIFVDEINQKGFCVMELGSMAIHTDETPFKGLLKVAEGWGQEMLEISQKKVRTFLFDQRNNLRDMGERKIVVGYRNPETLIYTVCVGEWTEKADDSENFEYMSFEELTQKE